MRALFALTGSRILLALRDPLAFLLYLLFPSLLVGILGLAFQGTWEAPTLTSFPISVLDETTAPKAEALARALQEALRAAEPSAPWSLAEGKGKDLSTALTLLRKEELGAVLVLRDGGNSLVVDAYLDERQPTQAAVVLSFLDAFQTLSSSSAAPQSAGALPIPLEVKETSLIPVGPFAYYTLAMGVMFSVFVAFGGAGRIVEDRNTSIFARISTYPVSKSSILAGYLLGNAFVIWLSLLLLLVVAELAFGVRWHGLGLLLVLAGMYALAWSGISLLLATIANDAAVLRMLGGFVGMAVGSISGSMYPLYLFPPSIAAAAHLLPNTWALEAMLNVAAGLPVASTWPAWIALTAYTVGSLALATQRLTRQGGA
ncbi:ABC transporter permease [Brockia lithotrophica]|uniref:ABC-type multidrug transport system permease subunit n=1 Tax=Brockia lithotrophica TaxID=933949 RepID=A0A660L6H3_9BACL|nr:ABC transporter permease [Brockia lithotrophica]RKQ89028.1 ABC-type multidrug transport system permease subunit [Brockia lithotrophica]